MTDDRRRDEAFKHLGSIVRELHEAMRELGLSPTLGEIACEIPDARERLSYVATMTEQAAHKVLSLVDLGNAECDAVVAQGRGLAGAMTRLAQKDRSADEYKALMRQCGRYAERASAFAEGQKAVLLDIMMAQDFQDLSGQIIKRVIGIIAKTETQLLELLVAGAPEEAESVAAAGHAPALAGPSVPHKALKQDDVDGLLETLGF